LSKERENILDSFMINLPQMPITLDDYLLTMQRNKIKLEPNRKKYFHVFDSSKRLKGFILHNKNIIINPKTPFKKYFTERNYGFDSYEEF
jgi:hypothetical protein